MKEAGDAACACEVKCAKGHSVSFTVPFALNPKGPSTQ